MGLRHATETDLQSIVDIYNASVPTRLSTADTTPVSTTSRLAWFRQHNPDRRPLMVYEEAGVVLGWISFESFYGRPAYQHTAELSIYIAPEHQGKRLGQRLLQAAEDMAPGLGLKALVGYVFAHNRASVRLFQAHGFDQWGLLPDVAEMDGALYSLCILGKHLSQESDTGKSVTP